MYKEMIYAVGMILWQGIAPAQIKWDGGAGNGLWKAPLNWSSDAAPLIAPDADILLDNSLFSESYSVKIVEADFIVVRSLIISPDPGKTITVLIDSSSVGSIALTVGSAGQGIVIEKGGQLINASKASNGAVISLGDSLRINNGGLYSHQTRRAHAALISRLSRSPGTEDGVFEFNIPSASNTLSLSNQVYGTLRLSNQRYGAHATYSGGAANPLVIRGNLQIEPEVTFTLNFSDTVFIRKDFVQKGGILNMANSTRNTVMAISGNINQEAGEIIKSGTGMPELIWNGVSRQYITIKGGINGAITVKVDNPFGVTLQAPLVVPYLFILTRGQVFTSSDYLLTLAVAGKLIADPATESGFIDGPLRKEGLLSAGNFLFPVGKQQIQRWICLKNATGNFTAEFFQTDPHVFSSRMGKELDHISSTEYWTVRADPTPAPSAEIELSYSGTHSGGVTDLNALRVSYYNGEDAWESFGNVGTTGSPGSDGSVLSEPVTVWQPEYKFTLASSAPVLNPLPVKLIFFTAGRVNGGTRLAWKTGSGEDPDYFDVESSTDGYQFVNIHTRWAATGIVSYEYMDPSPGNIARYYRLKIISKNGESVYSKTISVNNDGAVFRIKSVSRTSGTPVCIIQSDVSRTVKLELFDMYGKCYGIVRQTLEKGDNTVRFNVNMAPGGIYLIRATDQSGAGVSMRFFTGGKR